MTHGSLFSGIGGFDLAAEWMGWTNVFHCEIDGFCQKILKQYWPNATSYQDIKQTDFTIHRGLDILTGGFPCQPYSTAGKRKGKEDERHLWPEMLRAIREIQPRWVVGENVRGLTNWNGGMVFDEVQADLETQGYQVLPFLLPACAVNAPHRRDRIWFIAHSNVAESGNNLRENGSEEITLRRKDEGDVPREFLGSGITADTSDQGLQRCEINGGIKGIGKGRNEQFAGLLQSNWEKFPTQPPVCGGNDGVPNRVDRIKALGNAVVPQVVYEIFKAIEEYDRT